MIEEKKIKFLQFSILSPDEIKKISETKIHSDLTFETRCSCLFSKDFS